MSKRYEIWFAAGKVLADAVLINIAFFVAYKVRYQLQWFREVEPRYYHPYGVFLPSALGLMAILLLIYWWDGVYSTSRGRTWLDKSNDLLRGTMTGTAAMMLIVFIYRPFFYSRLIFGYAGVFVFVLLNIGRLLEGAVRERLRRRGIGVRRALIVGAGEIGRTVMRNLMAQPEIGYEVVGFVDDAPEKGHTDMGRLKALGDTANIPTMVAEHAIDEVIITLPWISHRKIMRVIAQCERQNVRVKLVPDMFQISISQVELEVINGIPMLGVREPSIRGWNRAVKRTVDVLVVSLGLVILSPLMALIALAIRLNSQGPVIFKQIRVGRDGEEFLVYKFRTMREDAEDTKGHLSDQNEAQGPIFKIRDDPRCTRVGRFLRRSSLDELPQLYNVLRGEMSLIGPRPPIPDEVKQYKPWQQRRLETSPGITGLWQVSGRSDLTFDEMVLLDLFYIENWSLLLDIKIALRTIPTIMLGTGAY
ncbi:MAG: undecaprenyl-phosphate glucose phosphotransferase [Anaerolineae bacterium]|nr:undecaprenyl-phosphate glucose phosphotransferase [Anaerolineae bacterium]